MICQLGFNTQSLQVQPPSSISSHQPYNSTNIQDQQQQIDHPSQPLSRSKSLNDISNDSQILAFASDGFINLNNNTSNNGSNNNQQNQSQAYPMKPSTPAPQHGMSFESPIIMTHHHPHHLHQHHNMGYLGQPTFNNSMVNGFNNGHMYGGMASENSRNLNTNQCSTNRTTQQASPNVFSICNPLAINNLNGVTEQISNFHL